VRITKFALFGILTGAAAATACAFLRLGEPAAVEIGGYCFGIKPTSTGPCGTVDGALYLIPGLGFGVVFGLLLWRARRLTATGAILNAGAAALANAVAVFLCTSLHRPIDDLLPFGNPFLDLSIAGVIAGAVGGGMLGLVHARLDRTVGFRRPLAVAAGLGVLTPIMIMLDDPGGLYAFYMIWQGGYAAALAASLRHAVSAPTA